MKPVIIGCRTDNFTPEQLEAFKKHQPFGMVIFGEPFAKGKDAVRHVIQQLRSVCPHAKVFIDAEGGRVNRLKPEYGHGWRDVPSARSFAQLALQDLQAAKAAIYANARQIAQDLVELGIDVNCAPVVDLVKSDVIANKDSDGKPHATSASLFNRSFGDDPYIVTECARAFVEGMESMGVTAIVKHVPGYGRVSADPHYAHDGIATSLTDLQRSDFVPFRNLKETRAMMTAHVIYSDIDPDRCATISPKCVDVIRKVIGFEGVLVADTIEMNAIWPEGFSKTARDQFGMGLPLPGALTKITKDVLGAGVDLVMHSDCSRDFAHTLEVLEAAPVLDAAKAKWLLDSMTVGSLPANVVPPRPRDSGPKR